LGFERGGFENFFFLLFPPLPTIFLKNCKGFGSSSFSPSDDENWCVELGIPRRRLVQSLPPLFSSVLAPKDVLDVGFFVSRTPFFRFPLTITLPKSYASRLFCFAGMRASYGLHKTLPPRNITFSSVVLYSDGFRCGLFVLSAWPPVACELSFLPELLFFFFPIMILFPPPIVPSGCFWFRMTVETFFFDDRVF